MRLLLGFAGIVIAGVVTWIVRLRLRGARRKKLRNQALPQRFLRILEGQDGLYRLIPTELKTELHGHMNVFLAEKKFIGCGGLEITDEIRVTVAAQACMLVLNRDPTYFPGFQSILVYPGSYMSTETSYDGLVEVRKKSVRAGESWRRGPVVLSWDDVQQGMLNPRDGYNVVLHEFAHKLDEENKYSDGLPILKERSQYEEWARIFGREYRRLEKRASRGKNAVLNEYALTSPSEFFAVATESFFEKPGKMNHRLPELYQQLSKFYRVDPAIWKRPLP